MVVIAGSIGIIGIALILAVSNGFQRYVDSIQEDALTSYPLMVMEESTDITGILLSMQAARDAEKPEGKVVEQPLISSMLVNGWTKSCKVAYKIFIYY